MRSTCSIVIAFVICFVGCRMRFKRVSGNGNITTEERSVGGTSKIKVLSGIDVIIGSGASSVKVEADENLLPYIETQHSGDYLVVKYKNNISLSSDNPTRVYIFSPDLSAVEVTGSGNVSSEDKLYAKEPVVFTLSGSGNISMNLNAPKIEAEIFGSGNLKLSGETRDVDVDIRGSGNYHGKSLKAENADIHVTGSGYADTFADVRLKANITGSGNIRYSGNAAVDKNIHGSGTVEKFD